MLLLSLQIRLNNQPEIIKIVETYYHMINAELCVETFLKNKLYTACFLLLEKLHAYNKCINIALVYLQDGDLALTCLEKYLDQLTSVNFSCSALRKLNSAKFYAFLSKLFAVEHPLVIEFTRKTFLNQQDRLEIINLLPCFRASSQNSTKSDFTYKKISIFKFVLEIYIQYCQEDEKFVSLIANHTHLIKILNTQILNLGINSVSYAIQNLLAKQIYADNKLEYLKFILDKLAWKFGRVELDVAGLEAESSLQAASHVQELEKIYQEEIQPETQNTQLWLYFLKNLSKLPSSAETNLFLQKFLSDINRLEIEITAKSINNILDSKESNVTIATIRPWIKEIMLKYSQKKNMISSEIKNYGTSKLSILKNLEYDGKIEIVEASFNDSEDEMEEFEVYGNGDFEDYPLERTRKHLQPVPKTKSLEDEIDNEIKSKRWGAVQ